jgi:hypothetical protein
MAGIGRLEHQVGVLLATSSGTRERWCITPPGFGTLFDPTSNTIQKSPLAA